MNYQGVVGQEIFLERYYTNAAPQHSLLNRGKQLWQRLTNYTLNSARAD
jgi:DNA/RNA endonuclease G (NUC1)